MVDFVTGRSIKVTGADKDRPHRRAEILALSSSLLFSRRCKQVGVSGPHNQRKCCLSESWTDLRSDSFRKECVWLGGSCRPTSCVNILSVPSNLSLSLHLDSFLCHYWALPLQHCHLAHLLFPHLLYPPSHRRFLSFPSFTSSLQPSPHAPAISTPTAVFLSPSPGRQASRLGAQMVLWRVSQLWVSEPAGRQDGPSVADMAEASPGTCLWLWTSRGTARLALREDRASTQKSGRLTVENALTHWHVTWLQFCQWPLDGVQSMK